MNIQWVLLITRMITNHTWRHIQNNPEEQVREHGGTLELFMKINIYTVPAKSFVAWVDKSYNC